MSDLFLRACRGEPTERIPLWVMRQAGRYLPEYRAVREKVDFLTLCRTPELCAQVTLQPIDRFGFDAAILFSDIMMPLESMGVDLQFTPGPVVQQPVRDAAAVRALILKDGEEIAPNVYETVRQLRGALKVPLIGFAGAPLTLAAYLVEGKGSKDFSKLRAFMYAQPDAMRALMDVLAECMLRYLRAQVEAGAQAVQLFDSWAGLLSLRDFRTFALPAVQKIMAGLEATGVPRIYFAQDAAALMPALAEVDAEVLGVDWRTALGDARVALGKPFVLQGNLDPATLFAPVPQVERATARVLSEGGGRRHIFNLGHGILPETPIPSVEALVQTVKAFRGGRVDT
ncbi:MAG TPA: uroporphyrinogen decarboxylase [Myxococcota bacterium]|nr:uroporphyrinogen decarboxylase [Myxococcota bacterium]